MEKELTIEISNLFHNAHWYLLMANTNLMCHEIFPNLSKAKMLCNIPPEKHHFPVTSGKKS